MTQIGKQKEIVIAIPRRDPVTPVPVKEAATPAGPRKKREPQRVPAGVD